MNTSDPDLSDAGESDARACPCALRRASPAAASHVEPKAATGPSARPIEPLRVARRDAAAAFERAYVTSVLERSGGNITRAAALAEVSRQMIQKLMRKYGL